MIRSDLSIDFARSFGGCVTGESDRTYLSGRLVEWRRQGLFRLERRPLHPAQCLLDAVRIWRFTGRAAQARDRRDPEPTQSPSDVRSIRPLPVALDRCKVENTGRKGRHNGARPPVIWWDGHARFSGTDKG